MSDYCAFSKNHKCIKWTDYQLLLHELEEADELYHGNYCPFFMRKNGNEIYKRKRLC